MKEKGVSHKKEKKERNRNQRKEEAVKAREAQKEVSIIEANMRKAEKEVETERSSAVKAAKVQKEEKPTPKSQLESSGIKRIVKTNRKRLTTKHEELDTGRTKKSKSSFMSLWEIVKGNAPSTRTSVKGQPHERDYTLITRHRYPGDFILGIRIPKNAQIKHVPSYPESPEHWEIKQGDAFVYIDSKINPIPGGWVNGVGEIKVKLVNKPNKGQRGVYVYLNIYPAENGQVPEYEVVFDPNTDTRVPGLHFGPSSGMEKTFLHLYPLEAQEEMD